MAKQQSAARAFVESVLFDEFCENYLPLTLIGMTSFFKPIKGLGYVRKGLYTRVQFDRSGNDIQITVSPCLTYFLACPIKDIPVVSDYYLLPDLPMYVAKSSA